MIAHSVSVVVPVYQGERTLDALIGEIEPLTREQTTASGTTWIVKEVVLVHDGAHDGSDRVMRELADRLPFVRCVWLSRNFGQHPATLAGISSTVSDWVATIDEDGQQDPRDIGRLLDLAIRNRAQLVYARPTNPPPHGALRNLASKTAKFLFVVAMGNRTTGEFNSFRLIRGEIARGVAAFCGESVYIDVALAWVVARGGHCDVALRAERGRPSGYNLRKLVAHFWQLILTSGTRPLRMVALVGVTSVVLGMALIAKILYAKYAQQVPVQGWTSLIIAISVFSGLILISLGIIAEYLGVAVSMAMGKPPYLIVSRPPDR